MQITWSEQRAFEKLLHVSPRVLLYPATCFCCNFQEALKWLGNPRHPQETSATLLQHGPSVLWAVSSQPFHHMPISKNNKVRYAIYSCWTLSQFHVHVNHFGQCKTEAKGIKNAKHSGACTVIVVLLRKKSVKTCSSCGMIFGSINPSFQILALHQADQPHQFVPETALQDWTSRQAASSKREHWGQRPTTGRHSVKRNWGDGHLQERPFKSRTDVLNRNYEKYNRWLRRLEWRAIKW